MISKDMKQFELSCVPIRGIKWYNHFWKTVSFFHIFTSWLNLITFPHLLKKNDSPSFWEAVMKRITVPDQPGQDPILTE
jgi:hypothetical protein